MKHFGTKADSTLSRINTKKNSGLTVNPITYSMEVEHGLYLKGSDPMGGPMFDFHDYERKCYNRIASLKLALFAPENMDAWETNYFPF